MAKYGALEREECGAWMPVVKTYCAEEQGEAVRLTFSRAVVVFIFLFVFFLFTMAATS